MEVGIAYFDSSPTSGGWFSVNGSRASRFSGIADLDPTVLWISNVGYQEYAANELRSVTFLRNSAFFRQSLSAIANELELSSEGKSISDLVESISPVASRVIALAEKIFPGIQFGMTLPDSIYDTFGFFDKKDPSWAFQRQIQSAFQENSIVAGRPWVPGSEYVTLVPNRVSYAEAVLSYPIPAGGIQEFDEPISIEEFLALETPSLAHADIDLAYAEDPALLAYGVQMSGTAIQREWLAQPEAHFMHMNGAKITIHRTIRAQSSTAPPQIPDVLLNNAFVRCSYSAGLVAEAMIFALMSKRYNPTSRGKTRYFFPFRAAYMRSVDRMLSFSVAKKLSDLGLRVKRYAYGSVVLNASREEIPEIMGIGADLGFMLLATGSLGKDG